MKFTGLLGAVGEVFFLVQEVHRHKTIIERRSEVNRLARAVEKLTSEAENSKEVHRLERENLRLQLQNALSHFERRVAAAVISEPIFKIPGRRSRGGQPVISIYERT